MDDNTLIMALAARLPPDILSKNLKELGTAYTHTVPAYELPRACANPCATNSPPFDWAENGGIMAWRWDGLVGIYLPLLRVLHGRRNPNHLHIRQRQEGASAPERRDAQGRLDERCRP